MNYYGHIKARQATDEESEIFDALFDECKRRGKMLKAKEERQVAALFNAVFAKPSEEWLEQMKEQTEGGD